MMELEDVMDVEMPDLPEFDMLEVVDGPHGHEECSSKVLDEWSKPESPLDDVVDEIMEIDVQMGEDLLDDKFFFNEDPCLSPTSALDDLVFSNTSLDEKELTLFAYPEENEAAAIPVPTVHSNIPTPPPSMSSFNKPKPMPKPSTGAASVPVNRPPVTAPRGHGHPPVPRAVTGHPHRAPVPYVTPPHHMTHMAGRPHVPIPPYPQHPMHAAHFRPPHPHAHVHPATKAKPVPRTTPPPTTTKSRSRPKQKKAPPKLNYIPAPPHMQPQPIAAAAAAAGAKRAAAAHAARVAAAAAAAAPKKSGGSARKSASPAGKSKKASTSSAASKKASPKTSSTNSKSKQASTAKPVPPPAFMKDEKYRSTLQKLTESMMRTQESRKCFHMKTDKTEKYERSKSVSSVLSSIDHSTRQIQTYLQGPAYGCGAISPPTPHHAPLPPASQPPAQPRKK